MPIVPISLLRESTFSTEPFLDHLDTLITYCHLVLELIIQYWRLP